MMNDELEICALLRRSADPLRAVDIALALALEFLAAEPTAAPVQPDGVSAQDGH